MKPLGGDTSGPASPESEVAEFAARLGHTRARIAAAAARAGRAAQDVTLVAVTKGQPPSALSAALGAGVLDVGENYVQEAADKRRALDAPPCRWHLLGHLQSNKAGAAVETFDLIQSVDSVRLARHLGRRAGARGKTQAILLQVHLGEEATKSGLPPGDVLDAAAEVLRVSGLSLQGLMGIAPQGEDARPHFRLLRRLFEALPSAAQRTLSMGMTGDFETAIEEGATMVRIGTALFGARKTTPGTQSPTGRRET